MKFEDTPPSADDVDQQRIRFRTYLNYLSAIHDHLRPQAWFAEEVLAEIAAGRRFQRIKRNPGADVAAVSRFLRNSWSTELQLDLSAEMPELLPVANHWGGVQLYYSVYLSLRAFFLSSGREVGNTHRAGLRTIASEVSGRPFLFPAPWRVVCVGDPDAGPCAYPNLPDGEGVGSISSLDLVGAHNFWSSYGMMLRTTRRRQITELADEWKSKMRRKRLDKGGRERINAKLPPATLFDFLYRLRIRSNYSDADSFLLSMEDIGYSAAEYNRALRTVCRRTNLVLELLTSRQLGHSRFGEVVEDFRRRIGRESASRPVVRRWECLCAVRGAL